MPRNSGGFCEIADVCLLPSRLPDDLIELRGIGRDRVAQTLDSFDQGFTLIDQGRVSLCADLHEAAVRDALISIYRPMQPGPVEAKRLTFSLDLLLFRAA